MHQRRVEYLTVALMWRIPLPTRAEKFSACLRTATEYS